MKTVYVSAWQYETGSGFDWSYKESEADDAYELAVARANCPLLQKEGWSAYRFDVVVVAAMLGHDISKYIFRNLDYYCRAATRKAENPLPSYGCTLSEIGRKKGEQCATTS